MKKTKLIISFFCAIFVLLFTTFVFGSYEANFFSNVKLRIAEPRIRIKTNTIKNIDILNENEFFNEFEVVNYDEYENVSEVNLSYHIGIKSASSLKIFKFKLYEIKEDGTENEIILTDDLQTTTEFTFQANQKQKHHFKLEIKNSLNSEEFHDNTEISIELQAIQKI